MAIDVTECSCNLMSCNELPNHVADVTQGKGFSTTKTSPAAAAAAAVRSTKSPSPPRPSPLSPSSSPLSFNCLDISPHSLPTPLPSLYRPAD